MKVMLMVPHLSDGGGERIVSHLSRGLRTEELIVVVFERNFAYPVGGRVVSLEFPIERKSILSRARGFIGRVIRFKRLLRTERPDAVISFMGEANLINALLSKRPILSVHNHLSNLVELGRTAAPTRSAKIRRWLEGATVEFLIARLYRRATVVAVSEGIKRELVERFHVPEKQVIVIPNAIDVEQIKTRSKVPADCPWSGDVPIVITAARLTVEKGQWHLMRAFAETRKQVPSRLAILGVGKLEDYLRRLAKELGIERDVFFLGWQENPFQFMSRADLFVLTSLTEGFGLVLLEAMTCGLPVVSSDCPSGPREILSPGTRPVSINEPEYAEYGVLLPAFDKQMQTGHDPPTPQERKLANVMVRLLQDRSLRERYIQAGLSRIQDYDMATFLAHYQHLITH